MKVAHRTHVRTCFEFPLLAAVLPFWAEPACASAAMGEVLICEASPPGARIKAQLGEKAAGDVKVSRSDANGQFVARLAVGTYTARCMIAGILGKKASFEILQASSANKLHIVLQVGMCT